MYSGEHKDLLAEVFKVIILHINWCEKCEIISLCNKIKYMKTTAAF